MLYDVLLHELGHLQLIDGDAPSKRLRFAREKFAQMFAGRWCSKLWSVRFPIPTRFITHQARRSYGCILRKWTNSYCNEATNPRNAKKKWSGWQELNLRGHVPKTCGWPLPYTRIWWLGTELNRIHWLFRPALCRRVPEPNFGGRCET